MNIYANRIKRSEIPNNSVLYFGRNEFNGKSVIIVSGGHLNHNGNIQIFAGVQGRWLMSVVDVVEINGCGFGADYYYLCD